MSKTYLFGKLGKSIKFNPEHWSAIGGDNEPAQLICKMAEMHPNDIFIIGGKSDYTKQKDKLNLPKNIRDLYSEATSVEKRLHTYVYDRLKDVKIDGCFLMAGTTSSCNIFEHAYKRKELAQGKKVYTNLLLFSRDYVGPLYYYLNQTNIPWILLANDPRYLKLGYDILNQPVKVLSQYDEVIELKRFDNFEDQNYISKPITCEYAEMEKIFLFDKKLPQQKQDKSINFMMVLNEGNNGVKSRYPMLKEYVLDSMEDVAIYGKWNKDTIGDDPRFKGPKKFEELQAELPNVKYTLIIPIKKGWVTAKWVEMISNGIIPFFHPTYDEQKHCNVPDYIRLENPSDLGKKIDELNANPDLYNKILKECIDCIKEDDLTGKNVCDIILNNTPIIKMNGKSYDEVHEQAESTKIKLEDW